MKLDFLYGGDIISIPCVAGVGVGVTISVVVIALAVTPMNTKLVNFSWVLIKYN